MRNMLRVMIGIFLVAIVLPASSFAQDGRLVWADRVPTGEHDTQVVWTSAQLKARSASSFARIADSAQYPLPDQINHIKNVRANADMDRDGLAEFMMPIFWIDGDGVNRRSIYVFESTGADDSYAVVWSYDFPGVADQFTTVDVSDLDGDGIEEILAVNVRVEGDNDEGPNLYVFENQGDNDWGTEPTVTWDLGNTTRDVIRVAKAADLDGDGKQEVVMASFRSQPAIVVASVSDFDLPVWTTEFVNNEIGGSSPDVAAIAIGDLDGDGTPEAMMPDGATDQFVVIEANGADSYDQILVPMPVAGKTVSVHGVDTWDANGDGRDEGFFANLQGAVWIISTDDVSTMTSANIIQIADTGEQWLEASTGNLSGRGTDFVIAGSNASSAWNYQYTGGPGGDVSDPGNYAAVQVVAVGDFAGQVPGGLRVYGLDLADDMDGDGLGEIIFTRGSSRGGLDAPAVFVMELNDSFIAVSLEDIEMPEGFALLQNYPNPFNPETTIQYVLGESGQVTLGIYNVLGQLVRTLVSGPQTPQAYAVSWDGTDASGVAVASGMYLYRLDFGDRTQVQTMMLLK